MNVLRVLLEGAGQGVGVVLAYWALTSARDFLGGIFDPDSARRCKCGHEWHEGECPEIVDRKGERLTFCDCGERLG